MLVGGVRVNCVPARRLLLVGVAFLMVSGCAVPSRSAAPGIAQADPLQPATIVWLQGNGVEVNDITVAVRLTLARGDGVVLWRNKIELDPSLPGSGIGFASGPSAGVFTYALVDVASATVHVVSAIEPEDRVIATIDETLVGGSIDPSGDWIYLATLTPDEHLRMSRLPASGGDVERVADLGPEFVATGGISSQDLMRWTPDGTRLLIQACDATGGCWWKVLAEASHELSEIRPAEAGTAVGVTNDTLLAVAADCAVGPCPFVLVDLATGDSRPFDPQAHEARTAISQDGHTVILYDNQGVGGLGPIADPARISAFDPATGQQRVVYESADPDGQFGLAREGQGTWAPAGWFVVGPGGQNVGEGGIGPILVRIADGLVVRLAAVPG